METTRSQSNVLKVGIAILAIATGLIHFSLALTDPSVRVIFTLNLLGYLSFAAALLLPLPIVRNYRRLVRYGFIGFTLLTIILWVFIGMRIPIAYVDKVIEVVLVILLFMERP
jgi:hypothetical protein